MKLDTRWLTRGLIAVLLIYWLALFASTHLPAGILTYTVTAGDHIATKRMILIE